MDKKVWQYQESMEKVIERLGTDTKKGLSSEEAKKRLERDGFNQIEAKKKHGPILIFLGQFRSVMIYILAVAGVIAYLMDHAIDTYVIGVVILINATIGFIQEYRAEKAIEAIKDSLVAMAKVFRNGELIETEAKNLVVGDVILLEEGDRIPGDARLIEAKNLRAIESSLTGESFPVEKKVGMIKAKTGISDRSNMVWAGTFVTGGRAVAVVVATGAETFIGKIASDMEKIKKDKSHFEKKTDKLAKQMATIGVLGASFIFILGYFGNRYEFSEILLFSMASLVSAIPEGLPAVLVIVLAAGANRMAKRKAIIRSLPATETLSVVDVIATDKTGTLTQNTMTVKSVYAGEEKFEVEGNGWKPVGNISKNGKIIKKSQEKVLMRLIEAGLACSNARLIKENMGRNRYSIKGDPTEGGMTVLAHKIGIKRDKLKVIDETAFDQEMRIKMALVKKTVRKVIYVSGAPEKVLKLCSLTKTKNGVRILRKKDIENINQNIEEMSLGAMRIIGLAYKNCQRNSINNKDAKNLVFLGLVGMIDPPRDEVKEAIRKAKMAGIRVIMQTGDHKNTALAIGKEVGIIDKNKNNNWPQVLSGKELFDLSPTKFDEAIEKVDVFARLTPKMKLQILETLQKKGHFVAMTGDGVNDALALKKANIGIAMGITGTDVAKEASDIVLADDNFASLIDAVEEARIVYVNTRQAGLFLVTTNFAEHVIVILSMILGWPLPLLATQILWLNLVTDGLSDISLAVEPGHGDVLDSPPRKPDEDMLSKKTLPFILFLAGIMVMVTLYAYNSLVDFGVDRARTMAFLVMALCQLFNLLNMRSLKRSVFEIGLFSNKFAVGAIGLSLVLQVVAMTNPFLKQVFRFENLNLRELLAGVTLASTVIWGGEAYKALMVKNNYS